MTLKKIYSMFFCAAVLFFAGTAFAERLDPDTIKELKPVEFMSEKDFTEKTTKIRNKPYGEELLEYRFNVPKDWEDNKVKLVDFENKFDSDVLSVLSRYISPPHPEHERSYLTVEGMKLNYAIGVKNWFINYVLINGLSLEGLTVNSEKELEALYVEVQKDITYIVRAKVIINGDKIIIARYYVSSSLYQDQKVIQAQIIDSFKLLNLDDSPIENLKTHAFLNQSYFDYPPSWELKAPAVKSIQEMKASLRLSLVTEKVDGKIDIKLFNKLSTPLRSEVVKKFSTNFSLTNYTIGKLIESPEIDHHKDMSFSTTQAYKLTPNSSRLIEYELWVNVMEGEDYIYLTSLVTPSRDEEFYIWTRNIESYKSVIENFRRHDENIPSFVSDR